MTALPQAGDPRTSYPPSEPSSRKATVAQDPQPGRRTKTFDRLKP